MRLLRFIGRARWLSEPRKLELYPPFFLMRIKVLEMRDEWRFCRIRLPLNTISRNPAGLLFGGWQAALADPIAALACARVFPGYSVWTRAMHLDFHQGGDTDLELRFHMSDEQENAIRRELEDAGRATPEFRYGFYRADGGLCTEVHNRVAVRPKGYRRAHDAAMDLDDF